MALEERFRQQIVGAGGIRIVGERLEIIAIPAGRFLVVLDALGLLGARMKVRRDILEVDLQLLHDLGILRALAVLPERRAEVVALDELVLAVDDQLAEAALGVGLDGLHGEVGRVIAVRIARHVGAVRGRGILVALLVDVQITESGIKQIGVRPLAELPRELLEGGGPVSIGERNAHDSQGVLDHLAIGALEVLEAPRLAVGCGGELLIQHRTE